MTREGFTWLLVNEVLFEAQGVEGTAQLCTESFDGQ
jgi:hypothetical protein